MEESEIYKTKRIVVPAMETILGEKFNVLDNGFVRVVDYLGGDAAIVQAARVSYGKGTKRVSEDRALIRYLMRNDHSSPFEMAELKLHVRVPMDCWRQWIRHRTANVNEYSTRYSSAIDEKQETSPEEWRLQAKDNKQGSAGFLPLEQGVLFSQQEKELHNRIKDVYEQRINAGIAKEQARKDLPLSNYTEAYWKIDLRNLLHFLKLRMDSHAQKEIRDYATIIGNEIVSRWAPYTWEAFNDYILNSITFSGKEIELMKQRGVLKEDFNLNDLKNYEFKDMIKDGEKELSREGQEFKGKLEKLLK